ncbi:MAG: aldo/keto reductase [Candidatus Omnitrophica bacterium]|nr:aldo/keto reductase [Candidatus Omnitrophota bacterium]
MRYREIGKSGINASIVGFGAWAIGGWMWGGAEEKEAIDAIKTAVDSGINLIDTAPVYGFGRSEEIVGKAIKGMRGKVVLATKCGLVWDKEAGAFHFFSDGSVITKKGGEIKVFKYLAPSSIREEIEGSLKRLETDYIDLYQTHWQDPTTPIEETMKELLKLKQEGKIRAIGVSNATTSQMDEYRRVGQIDSDQESYSMLDRNKESDNLPYCQKNNIAFLAYSPLARGLLTGKVSPDKKFSEGDHRKDHPLFTLENRVKVQKMLSELKPFTEKYNITFSQLAIAWVLHQDGCTHALVGARNPSQVKENVKAGDIVFSEEDRKDIRDIIERYF